MYSSDRSAFLHAGWHFSTTELSTFQERAGDDEEENRTSILLKTAKHVQSDLQTWTQTLIYIVSLLFLVKWEPRCLSVSVKRRTKDRILYISLFIDPHLPSTECTTASSHKKSRGVVVEGRYAGFMEPTLKRHFLFRPPRSSGADWVGPVRLNREDTHTDSSMQRGEKKRKGCQESYRAKERGCK